MNILYWLENSCAGIRINQNCNYFIKLIYKFHQIKYSDSLLIRTSFMIEELSLNDCVTCQFKVLSIYLETICDKCFEINKALKFKFRFWEVFYKFYHLSVKINIVNVEIYCFYGLNGWKIVFRERRGSPGFWLLINKWDNLYSCLWKLRL
jgi:hypothetical protein